MSRTEANSIAITDTPRVLLVASDPRFALLLTEMLRACWPQRLVVVQAQALTDAAQELTEHGAGCAFLELDPRASDPTAGIEQLRTASPSAAILALAHHPDEELALRVLQAGAQDVLLTPELHPALLRRSVLYAMQRKRSEVKLAELALHDPLTTLPNRALFLDRLGVALDRSRRTGRPLAVLFLDVDNFKQINDTLGHSAGDLVLVALAHRLRGMLRPMDTIARFGGDEFTLLFEDLASDREVVLVAERISHTARMPIALQDGEVQASISIGVTTVVDPVIPPEAVIREADAAMYRAKELGRGRYELFDESSRERAMQRIELEAALGQALERGELRVHYQPKVSLRQELGVVGFEALVRWQHPQRGLVAPAEFLPLAEETGLVLRIDEFVLAEAVRQAARWRTLRPGITVSVNLSARQLEDAGLLSLLTEQMREAQLEGNALCLEVSEVAVSQSLEPALRALSSLRELGVRVALDDYGTAPSPLQQLRRLPVDILKIDQTFVEDLHQPEPPPVIAALVDLGHALGLEVAAEGVETDAQLIQLRAAGCDDAQGYFLGRPVPEEEIRTLLLASRS